MDVNGRGPGDEVTSRSERRGVVRLCRWLLRYVFRRRLGLASVLAFMLLKTGLEVIRPWPLKVLVDNVLAKHSMPASIAPLVDALPWHQSTENLIGWTVAATVVIFLLGWGMEMGSTYASAGFGQRMVYDLAADLFMHLQRLSLGFHARKSVGDSIRRVTIDSHCVATIIEEGLLPLLVSLFTLVTMFVVMWQVSAPLTLVAVMVVPLILAALRYYAARIVPASYEQDQAEGRLADVVEQTLIAMPTVQAFGLEEKGEARFRAAARRALDATAALTSMELRAKILSGMTLAAGTAALLGVGAQQVMQGRLTVGGILVFLSYLTSLYEPLDAVHNMSYAVQRAAGGAVRVVEVLEMRQEVAEAPGARPLPPARGHIRFEGVSFGYEPGRPVLRDIELEVRPGQTVALVGHTGAGKSTLVSLLPRFFDPGQGRVLIDGQNVRGVTLRSLRGQIGIVLQEPFLFPLSVAENIAYGRPGASPAEIEAAARAANAHDFISRLPVGYETVLGERGGTLSGGERQRLAIARALLKDAPILILDEPTSALDGDTESQLLEALGRLMAGRTTLLIAHRLSTIRDAETIAVLEAGRLVELGSHQRLLAQGGVYARFHRSQVVHPG